MGELKGVGSSKKEGKVSGEQAKYDTGDSSVIPHRSTSPAWRRLASEFEMGSGAGGCSMVVSV